MKALKRFGLILLTLIPLAGCVTKNPNYSPAAPVSQANPLYVPDTNSIAKVGGVLSTVNAATAPVDPYAPIADRAIEFGLGLATIFAGLVANSKNKKAQTATAAAQTLATALPDNLVQKAIESAPTPAISAAVAAHLQAAPNTGNA